MVPQARDVPVGHGTQNIKIHKRDRDLMKMLSGEVFVYCVTTIPHPINFIYNVSTNSIAASKSSTKIAIESLIGYIISPLLNFMYCCIQFYGKRDIFHDFLAISSFCSICFMFSDISKKVSMFIPPTTKKYNEYYTNDRTHDTSIYTILNE
jgi:hypothetical protein